MDRDGEHYLNDEFCFFGSKHKHCRGFVTLTATVYNSLFRKQVTLAIMEAEAENAENVSLFWTLFNEVIKKISGNKSAMFNPTGWCADMEGANLAGICNVLGNVAKTHIKNFILKTIGIKRPANLTVKAQRSSKFCAISSLNLSPKFSITILGSSWICLSLQGKTTPFLKAGCHGGTMGETLHLRHFLLMDHT